MDFHGIKVERLNHDTVRLEKGIVVYIDPYKVQAADKADIILITHSHFDHCSIEDLMKLVKPDTTIVTIADCQSKLRMVLPKIKALKLVEPGSKVEIDRVLIEAVPAYNIGKEFHPKDDNLVGYIITIGGKRIYHSGDTDLIPEMSSIKADLAFLPVSGAYTMNAAEAAEAANIIKPEIAVPMHYGDAIGSIKDAEEFKRLVKGRVEII